MHALACCWWCDPHPAHLSVLQFTETESFIKTGEELLTPYVWGIYDVLCLPPSFPYGGMENPCLTFVTPTIVAGDKSLADVVCHEIAHSWTGYAASCCCCWWCRSIGRRSCRSRRRSCCCCCCFCSLLMLLLLLLLF